MSAQRNPRFDPSRAPQGQNAENAPRRDIGGAHRKQERTPRDGENPKHDEVQRQNQSSWNTRQNPEHPERPADGGETELKHRHPQREVGGNTGSNGPQNGDRRRTPRDGSRRLES